MYTSYLSQIRRTNSDIKKYKKKLIPQIYDLHKIHTMQLMKPFRTINNVEA